MNFSEHCDLCENEIANLDTGLSCKLTNQYPNFKHTCPEINLGEKFQDKIETINLELKRVKRNKKSVYIYFYFLIIIGFIIVIGGDYFIKSTFKSVYTLKIAFGIISVGITFLVVAYSILNRFRKKLRNAELEKKELDVFLMKYRIDYKVNFDFKKKIHGIQEVILELEFNNWIKKNTKNTYKIR